MSAKKGVPACRIVTCYVNLPGPASPVGAALLTAGIFLPAFLFTLLAHDSLERIVHKPRIRSFLDGVMAGVVGLIAGTTITLMRVSVVNWQTALVFALALIALIYWKTRLAVPMVIGLAAVFGWISAVLG